MAIVHLAHVGVSLMGRQVLRGLNGTLEQGQRVLLTGANGAGKTTLLRLLATAIRPSFGTLSLFGGTGRAHLVGCRPRLALMTHQHYFYEPLTAWQNLQLVAQLTGQGDNAAVSSLLERVGLLRHRARPVAQFSAGMKRRLALARVLLLQPELLLIDEPFTALDPDGVTLMHDSLAHMAGQGVTVVLATHDIERGLRLSTIRWHLDATRPGLAPCVVKPHEAVHGGVGGVGGVP